MKKKKELIETTIILFLISIIYTLLVKYYDVAAIGPNKTSVGFKTINSLFHSITGYNDIWYKITKYLGYIPFLIVMYYGLIGLRQLIKKKNLKKVDKKLIILGTFYILVGLTYIFFEKVIINYRPILINNELEASYPSSHTILAITICISSIMMSKYYINEKKRKTFDILTWCMMIIIVIGRLASGVHWLTDIIGGIIISTFLLSTFNLLLSNTKK